MKKNRIKLLLTCGDIAGIGPEIILKIFNKTDLFEKYDIKICADEWMFTNYLTIPGLKNLPEGRFENLGIKEFNFTSGKSTKKTGEVSAISIYRSVELCKNQKFDGMITLPISKESINSAGFKFPGHTELIGKILNEKPVMMFYSNKFIASLITSHIPLKKVYKKISEKIITEKVMQLNGILKSDFKIKNPKFGILSLNPHSGDNGLLGDEELKVIIPAIKKLNKNNINAIGPFASDGYFGLKNFKNFNVTIGMYHDQILNPFKLLCFEDGVNFTGGLSIVRTSPDHGTAFDIAGKGIAQISSTLSAIKLAAKIASNRKDKNVKI